MKNILDLNSLSLIDINIDGKLALSEMLDPSSEEEIQQLLQRIKMELHAIALKNTSK